MHAFRRSVLRFCLDLQERGTLEEAAVTAVSTVDVEMTSYPAERFRKEEREEEGEDVNIARNLTRARPSGSGPQPLLNVPSHGHDEALGKRRLRQSSVCMG